MDTYGMKPHRVMVHPLQIAIGTRFGLSSQQASERTQTVQVIETASDYVVVEAIEQVQLRAGEVIWLPKHFDARPGAVERAL